MISRLSGTLVQTTEDGRALVRCEAITYEILVPAADVPTLAAREGETVEFDTLHYLESHGQGSTMLPRLIGFTSEHDRSFFELFTTVKNIGYRKALRALQLPFNQIASAIAAKDAAGLTALPEIGKRTAETIIAELNGKVDAFLEGTGPMTMAAVPVGRRTLAGDTLFMLTALGESPTEARRFVEQAINSNPDIEAPEDLLAAVYRLKETVS
ncbi:MAG: helix-hairpin-helix domain-containing protein [Phycisphaerales bacterium]|nr:helix-hairpin-helix domain-containing protein [Phycisphaerales bacterium]